MNNKLQELKEKHRKCCLNRGISIFSIKDIEWFIGTIENQQAEIDTLSMAHDEMHRLIEKDKHFLIKSNIALNNKVQELEEDNEDIRWLCADTSIKLQESDKRVERYREALDYIRNRKSKPHEKYINHLKAVADDALEGDLE